MVPKHSMLNQYNIYLVTSIFCNVSFEKVDWFNCAGLKDFTYLFFLNRFNKVTKDIKLKNKRKQYKQFLNGLRFRQLNHHVEKNETK